MVIAHTGGQFASIKTKVRPKNSLTFFKSLDQWISRDEQ